MSDEGMQPGLNGLGGSAPVSALSGIARGPSQYIGGDRASYGYRLLSSEAARRLAETLRAGQSTVLQWTCKPPVDAGQSSYTLQTEKYGNTVLNLKPSLTDPWMIPLLALMREAYEDTLREFEDSKGALDAQITQALQIPPGADDEFPEPAISAAAKYLLAKEQMKKTAEMIERTWDDAANERLAYRLWLQDKCGATLRLSEKQGEKVSEWARLTEPSALYDEMSKCGEIYRKTLTELADSSQYTSQGFVPHNLRGTNSKLKNRYKGVGGKYKLLMTEMKSLASKRSNNGWKVLKWPWKRGERRLSTLSAAQTSEMERVGGLDDYLEWERSPKKIIQAIRQNAQTAREIISSTTGQDKLMSINKKYSSTRGRPIPVTLIP